MKNRIAIIAVAIFTICAAVFTYYQLLQSHQLKNDFQAELNDLNQQSQQNKIKPVEMTPQAVLYDNPVPADEPEETITVIKNPNVALTYHEVLLKTNPVEALKLQSEERGHINAKWIPPFPADDLEAQGYARSIYQFIYNYNNDNPIYIEGVENNMILAQSFHEKHGTTSARSNDLHKLSWVILDFPMNHYYTQESGGMTGYAMYSSDYFPSHISELK